MKKLTNKQVQYLVTGLSLILFIGKFIAYFLTHSLSILSDALESTINIFTGFVGIYALILASKPKDAEHLYGHGKVEYIAAGIEGTLIVVSGFFILQQALTNDDAHVHALPSALIILFTSMVLTLGIGFIAKNQGRGNQSPTLYAAGKHLLIDAVTSAIVLLGILIIQLTNAVWIDKYLAIILSVWICKNGYNIIRSSLAGIMDETDKALVSQIIALLNEHRNPNWIDIHNLRVLKYGSKLHLDCHLTVAWYLNVHEAHKQVDELTSLLYQHYGTNQIEMFIHVDGCLPLSCKICAINTCSYRKQEFEKTIAWNFDNVIENQKHTI